MKMLACSRDDDQTAWLIDELGERATQSAPEWPLAGKTAIELARREGPWGAWAASLCGDEKALLDIWASNDSADVRLAVLRNPALSAEGARGLDSHGLGRRLLTALEMKRREPRERDEATVRGALGERTLGRSNLRDVLGALARLDNTTLVGMTNGDTPLGDPPNVEIGGGGALVMAATRRGARVLGAVLDGLGRGNGDPYRQADLGWAALAAVRNHHEGLLGSTIDEASMAVISSLIDGEERDIPALWGQGYPSITDRGAYRVMVANPALRRIAVRTHVDSAWLDDLLADSPLSGEESWAIATTLTDRSGLEKWLAHFEDLAKAQDLPRAALGAIERIDGLTQELV